MHASTNRGKIVMSKQFGVSSLLAAAASFLLVGMVAAGSVSPAAAAAASEEDLAAPHGSFVSTLPVPAKIDTVVYSRGQSGQLRSVAQIGSEEDLAAPHGSFISTMAIHAERGNQVRVGLLSEDDVVDYAESNQADLKERIAASLE
jgi:hypothetical protein